MTKKSEDRTVTKNTIEKDIDLSTDRDVSRGVERSSYTGTDDKSQAKMFATDVKVDVGEAESNAANLANVTGVGNNLLQMAIAQSMRFAEDNHAQQMRHGEELSVIKQRQLSNGADYDQVMREMSTSHSKSRNSQDVRHADVATDRIWNMDEQVWAVAKTVEALGVDHRIAFAAVLESLASVVRESSPKK
jgi:ribosomal protein S13